MSDISPAERQAIVDSWALVKANPRLHGSQIFINLFKAHPQYHKKFPNLADIPIDELANNKKMLAHASNVIFQLDNVVFNLDDVDVLREVILKMGRNHANRAVTISDFEVVKQIILDYLAATLGAKLSSAGKTGWEKALSTVTKVMDEGMKA